MTDRKPNMIIKTKPNMILKHIKIYRTKPKTSYQFCEFDTAQQEGFSEDQYYKIFDKWMEFEDNLINSQICEILRKRFYDDEDDIERPPTINGHYLTVSDIIVINDFAYYCNCREYKCIDWKYTDSHKEWFVVNMFFNKLNIMVQQCDEDIEYHTEELKGIINGNNIISEREGYLGTLIRNTAQRRENILEIRKLYTSLLMSTQEIFEN